jgi:folate-dependent phosphoribosylglycinamide formyltransferase PurN
MSSDADNAATAAGEPRVHTDGRVLLLAGPGDSTDIVANFLASRVPDLVVVMESPPSRLQMARRRARRVGWLSAVGQVLFVVLLQPVLRRRGARRRAAILAAASLDVTHRPPHHRVPSVNDERMVSLLTSLRPAMVVVNGTRILSPQVLGSAGCPVTNLHAGITPRYRGVHGGYWALADQHPEWVGTTVHLVDPGIDTGGILAQSVFEVTSQDSFATYPYLHLVTGLPLLGAQVDKVLAGAALEPTVDGIAPGSGLYYHPTIWGYLRRRWHQGVR